MADVRMIAALAVAACSSADAQSGSAPAPAPAVRSNVKVPASWQAAPAIVEATRTAAAGAGVTVDGVEAWAEPAMGCYAVWLALRGAGGGGTVLSEQVLKSLADAGIATRDLVQPTSEAGVLAATFERTPYEGRLRARIAEGSITALACFANQRERSTCETACMSVLGALP